MTAATHVRPEFVTSFPTPMEHGVIYVSIEYNNCGHLCACGWTQLGDARPAGLVTAALTGTSSLRDAAAWARRVAPATTDSHWEHSAPR